MPIFYCVDAAVQGEGAGYAKHKFETEIVETMKANWALWLPAQASLLPHGASTPAHHVAWSSFCACANRVYFQKFQVELTTAL
eukprot:6198869-Pleurochrysis_carterae.AAC.4